MKYITIALLIGFLFTSCEEQFTSIVEYDLPEHDSRIVSFCFVENNQDSISVAISQSIGTLEGSQEAILKEVSIKLMKGDELLTDKFELSTTNNSSLTHVYKALKPELKEGEEYRLEVSSNGLPHIEGTSMIQSSVKLDAIGYTKDGTTTEDGYVADEITVDFTDPSDEENYYVISGKYEIEGGENNHYNGLYFMSKDPRFQMVYESVSLNSNLVIGERSPIVYFSDSDGLNGRSNKLKFHTYSPYFQDDVEKAFLKIRIFSIPKEMYQFIISSGSNSDFDIFSEPKEITSNMENGFGIFSMFSYDELELEIDIEH